MITFLLAATERLLKGVLTLLSLALVGVVFTQVVLRYAFSSGFNWAEEASRYLFLWLVFLGIALGVKRKSHIAVTMIIDKLKLGDSLVPRLQAAVAFVFFLILAWTGIEFMESGRNVYSSVMYLELYWVYAVIPVAGAFCLLFSLLLVLAPAGRPQKEV